MKRVEFHYDLVCPYAYLASTQIEGVASRHGAVVEYRPFLLGGLFRALGLPADAKDTMSAAKRRHDELDMHRWAAWFGVPFRKPAEKRRTVLALRSILALPDAEQAPAMHALYAAIFVRDEAIDQEPVVARVLAEAGLDGEGAVVRAGTPEIKDALRARTDEAVRRGVFGAPAMFVDGELYWGQDRLDFVNEALAG